MSRFLLFSNEKGNYTKNWLKNHLANKISELWNEFLNCFEFNDNFLQQYIISNTDYI